MNPEGKERKKKRSGGRVRGERNSKCVNLSREALSLVAALCEEGVNPEGKRKKKKKKKGRERGERKVNEC